MLEKPNRKKIDKRDGNIPTNFEQLIQRYDLEKIWPYIEDIIEKLNGINIKDLEDEYANKINNKADKDTTIAGVNLQDNITSNELVAALKNNIVNLTYPIGSIYMSVNSTSPATLFGGTWERLKSRFLLGADDSTYKLGNTGGSTTHKHSTGNHTLTIDEIPSHTHPIPGGDGQRNGDNGSDWQKQGWTVNTYSKDTGSAGGGKAHNHGNTGDASNLPPYLAVYMWKRTA